jgi:hypothetical protein
LRKECSGGLFPYLDLGNGGVVSVEIKWRDLTKRGIAAWANQTLDERVLDLLSDIMLATEEIESMVLFESRELPFDGFYAALHRIYSEAAAVMGKVIEPERKSHEH